MEKKHNVDKFQGYPHYPASEDITRAGNNNGKERLDEEVEPASASGSINKSPGGNSKTVVPATDSDVTPEDLRMLENTDQDMDTDDDRNLKHAALDDLDDDGDPLNEEGSITNMAGEGLDIPGSSDDDNDELIGEEDEENNYYSLGGDLHESQEENKGE